MGASRHKLLACAATMAVLTTGCAELDRLSTDEALDRLEVATTRMYDAGGNVIANLHGEINREIVPIERVPKHVRDAVVAIEDERFWAHQGLDLRAVTRAAVSNLSEASSPGGRIQGGSTISQQLAKNLYFPRPDRTLARKLDEARVTWQLERQYSKAELLEMYLNTIYFGRGVYGIETAAKSYFGRSAAELTIAQAAFLAGVIHEPARYDHSAEDPHERQEERVALGTARRNLVLGRMEALGSIDATTARAARDEPLHIEPRPEARWRHPYFVDLVLRQLGVLRTGSDDRLDPRFDFLGETFEERAANVYRGGLRIHTALDPQAQAAAERAVTEHLPAELDRLSAALVAIEPSTGYIRALIGGRDYYPDCPDAPEESAEHEEDGAPSELPHVCRLAKVNLALGADGGGSGRQPGSAFKTFTLTAALMRGMSLHQTYPSSPFTYHHPGSPPWNVTNYAGAGEGSMTLLSGTQRSVNAVFAHLIVDGVGDGDGMEGAERVATIARRMGIGFPTPAELEARCGEDYLAIDACLPADNSPAITLGAKEVSPLDMASAYATLAADGVRTEPTTVVRVTDPRGRVLYEAAPERRSVVPSGVARAVTYALEQVVSGGTARRASLDRPAAAKTGTSQAWRDAWLAGYVPQLAAVVWVGNPIPRGAAVESMTPANGYPYRIVGGTLPSVIWQAFMAGALEGVPVRGFPPPPSAFFGASIQAQPEEEPEAEPDDDEIGAVSGAIRVPQVVGTAEGIARSRLRRSGFRVTSVHGCDPTGGSRLHRVWDQSPSAGTVLPPGTTVTITYDHGDCD